MPARPSAWFATLGAPLLILSLAACGASAQETSPAQHGPTGGQPEGGAERTLTDATGAQVKVPADPKSIVVTHYAGTQALLDLGVTPVGMGNITENYVPPEYWAKIKDVPQVDKGGAIDVASVAAQSPDLILVPNVVDPKVATQLQGIAPVYTFTLRGGQRANWQKRVEEIAAVVDKTDDFTKLKNDFAARQKEIASTHQDVLQGKVYSIVDSFESGNLYLWGEKTMTGSILAPLGLKVNPSLDRLARNADGESEGEASKERLADVLTGSDIILHNSDLLLKPSEFVAPLLKDPLYTNTEAVKAGRTAPIGKTTIAGFGDANFVLDQVEKLTEKLS